MTVHDCVSEMRIKFYDDYEFWMYKNGQKKVFKYLFLYSISKDISLEIFVLIQNIQCCKNVIKKLHSSDEMMYK